MRLEYTSMIIGQLSRPVRVTLSNPSTVSAVDVESISIEPPEPAVSVVMRTRPRKLPKLEKSDE